MVKRIKRITMLLILVLSFIVAIFASYMWPRFSNIATMRGLVEHLMNIKVIKT